MIQNSKCIKLQNLNNNYQCLQKMAQLDLDLMNMITEIIITMMYNNCINNKFNNNNNNNSQNKNNNNNNSPNKI